VQRSLASHQLEGLVAAAPGRGRCLLRVAELSAGEGWLDVVGLRLGGAVGLQLLAHDLAYDRLRLRRRPRRQARQAARRVLLVVLGGQALRRCRGGRAPRRILLLGRVLQVPQRGVPAAGGLIIVFPRWVLFLIRLLLLLRPARVPLRRCPPRSMPGPDRLLWTV
jgi:hypothetical protein